MSDNKPTFTGLFVQYNDGKEFILEAQKSNHSFNLKDCRYITPVAYPIVFVEVEALERTMEDFPIVEKTVLKLIRNQFTDPTIIAQVMGLTESYIKKIIKLLFAYGHIDENGITDLGIRSLELNSSVKMNTVKQKIQVNGLTTCPIDIRSFISEQILRNPKESGMFVAHLEPVECIEKSVLEGIIKSHYTDYINKGEMSLHTNVKSINYAKFKEIKYAKAYYLENSSAEAIIMCKCYDSTAKSLNERFTWKILYADNDKLRAKYNLMQNSAIESSDAIDNIKHLKNVLDLKRTSITDEIIAEMLSQLYPFNWNHSKLIRAKETTLYVTKESFEKYDKFLLKILESFADDKEDYIIFEELYGEYIKVKTNDEFLLKIASEYKEKSEKLGRTYIMNSMERQSEHWNGDIFTLLKNIIDNYEEA